MAKNSERKAIKAIIDLESASPVAFCKPTSPTQNENESNEEMELRTWRDRGHYDSEGMAYIPGDMFKKAIQTAAKFLNLKIAGEGAAKFTKNFRAGILVENDIPLNVHKNNIYGDCQYVPTNGIAGSARRVHKYFPEVSKWSGKLVVILLDEKITKEIFERVIEAAGTFIGVGRFRPINGGDKGRFIVKKLKFEEIEL